MLEIWLPVVGYEGLYEVSDLGRVRSLDKIVPAKAGSTRVRRGRIIRPRLRNKYLAVGLFITGGERKDWSVHDLVLAAFVGPKPEGWEADHISRNKMDNRDANLRYVTPAVNSQNKSTTILTDASVADIRSALRDGRRKKDIAAEFNISRQMVRAIEVGRTWKTA